jgi:mono/diheme cytochrome c family protein
VSVARRAALLLAATVLGACSESSTDDAVSRGRNSYLALCTSCHGPDPAQPGPVGPPVKGASRELLESKVLRGQYPPGYTPKRPTAVMPPMPQLSNAIPDLAAYLKQ